MSLEDLLEQLDDVSWVDNSPLAMSQARCLLRPNPPSHLKVKIGKNSEVKVKELVAHAYLLTWCDVSCASFACAISVHRIVSTMRKVTTAISAVSVFVKCKVL